MALFLAVLIAVATVSARAQTTASPAPPPSSVSAADLQRLVATLQDPTQRAALVTQLQALIAAQRGLEKAPAAAAGPTTFVDRLSQQVSTITGEILAAAQVVVDAPRLVGWVEAQIGNERTRRFWLDVSGRLAVIFGVGFAAEWIVRALLAGFSRRLARASTDRLTLRLALILLGFVAEALPVLAFAGVAALTVPFTHALFRTRHVASVLIEALLKARLVLVAVRAALLSPSAVALYPLGGETRQYLYIWARRFTTWAVYGFAVASGSWWLGVPGAIYALLLRGTILMLAILGVVFVLQNRKTVAEWLRGNDHGPDGWRIIRHRLADTWHVLAIVYVAGTFGVFVLGIPGGFLFLLRATVITVVVLLAAALLVRGIERVSRRGFAIGADLKLRYPTLETRANRYVPVLYYVSAAIIDGFAALTILEAWGVNAFAWLGTDTGRRITTTLVTTAIVVVAALMLWEIFSAAIERYLHAGDGAGGKRARSARIRTLVPLFRTTVLVVLSIMVALIVLSQIGVNIAPLLAGAGVVGLAIGFGSQALVKDVINGLFILVEDTLAIGDVVDVGNKHAGVVEAISIRAIRLRDSAGTVHTVPFSDVTTVKNLTKDYAYYVFDVGVSYREDTDAVVAVLRNVADEMRADPAFAPLILEPLEVWGVDRFEDSAVVIQVRLKTPPIQQWTVGREFNRRMKKAFDERGIEMPYPHRTIYFGADRQGAAPPVRVALDPARPAGGEGA
ncbi:MAG TPA: mechanosensitive ion channel domain-containing protein [Stellaceae bacterium]|nr:mechanosensitive ion channel domain-containing protein [Stellaceae bacterium]